MLILLLITIQQSRANDACSNQIPIIDFSDAGHLIQLDLAFRATGFAVIKGFQEEIFTYVQEVTKAAEDFFQLPLETKIKFQERIEYTLSGFTPSKTESVSRLIDAEHNLTDEVEALMFIPNKTYNIPILEKFSNKMFILDTAFQDLIERSLILPSHYLNDKTELLNVRFAHYPQTDCWKSEIRYGAHIDSYGLTVLITQSKGLEVLSNDSWIEVPVLNNSFILNVGAALSRWTNGLWKPATHRVKCIGGKPRISIVTSFANPKSSEEIYPGFDPGLEVKFGAPKFPTIQAEELYEERRKMHNPNIP